MCEYIIMEDYYLPCLTLPPEDEKPIGIWGQRHKRYLKDNILELKAMCFKLDLNRTVLYEINCRLEVKE